MLDRSQLDPKLEKWLAGVNEQLSLQGDAAQRVTPQLMRKSLARMTDAFVTDRPTLASVFDSFLNGPALSIPLRLYDPAPAITKPVTMFIHGGGHMCGSIDVYDTICRKLANASGHLVVALEYRLAPEHPYPAALEDCLAVIRGLWGYLDKLGTCYTPELNLVGDSGGGALCATLSALSQRDPSLPIRKQALIYPSLDYTLSCSSVDTLGYGYLLEKPRIHWYFDHYFQNNECRRSTSPLSMEVADKHPATLIITAGFCPLRDEGKQYIRRLSQTEVVTKHHFEKAMIHAYLNLEDLVPTACARTYDTVAKFINS